MPKYLRVTMPDGSRWDVPAELIAINRATYYAQLESSILGSQEYLAAYNLEFAFTLGNHSELKDWAANEMNWKDVCSFARRVAAASQVNYQEGWINGHREVVELP